MRNEPLTAAIVGCGMIAGGYDMDGRDDHVRTHAGALTRRGVRLLACVEPDAQRRAAFMQRWHIERGYADLDAMLETGEGIDLVCVCTPNERHAADLTALLDVPLKAVFAEKPLAASLSDARRLADAYREARRSLAVNYTRRWNPAFRALASEIASGRFGTLKGITGWYGKGIVHNGAHMIDLLRMLVGELRPVRAERIVADARDGDPTVDALLRTGDGAAVRLLGTDHRDYDFFELQLLFSDAVLAIERGGTRLRVRPVEDNAQFVGHRRVAEGAWQDIATHDVMLKAVDNVIAHVTSGEPLASDGTTALAAQEIAAELVLMAGP